MRGIVQLNRILVRRVFVFSVRRILLAYAFFLDAHILEVASWCRCQVSNTGGAGG